MLGNIGSEGRVAGSLLLFCIVSFLCISTLISGQFVHISFYSLRSSAALYVPAGARERGRVAANSPLPTCAANSPLPTCACQLLQCELEKFFLDWVHFCIESYFVALIWNCTCGSAWNVLLLVILRNSSLSIHLGGLKFRVCSCRI